MCRWEHAVLVTQSCLSVGQEDRKAKALGQVPDVLLAEACKQIISFRFSVLKKCSQSFFTVCKQWENWHISDPDN